MEKHFIVFHKGADGGHAGVYFVLAEEASQAVIRFIQYENDNVVIREDGSLTDDNLVYPHPLAYIEAYYKPFGEWQIRALPDWTLQEHVAEVFCGESGDGPAGVIAVCRRELLKAFPRSRAKAFVWYLNQGTLVTFYRKTKPFQIEVLKRYLWDWKDHMETLEEWNGDHAQIVAALLLNPIRY